MHDVSASGVKLRIIASYTFPAGFDVSRFADDADPLDSANVDIADTGMAVNGEMVTWTTPAGVPLDISVLPGTDEADNLETLWAVNRVGPNKISIHDIITIVATYPSGKVVTLTNGTIVSGPALTSADSSARLKTQTYSFMFETRV